MTHQHWDGAVNRLYYAAFHALTAVMLRDDIRVRSHTGVRTVLGDHYVLTDRIEKQWAKYYSHLFRLRQNSDYEDFAIFTEEDVLPLVTQTEELITVIRRLITID